MPNTLNPIGSPFKRFKNTITYNAYDFVQQQSFTNKIKQNWLVGLCRCKKRDVKHDQYIGLKDFYLLSSSIIILSSSKPLIIIEAFERCCE